jgi:hypothetical protein
MGSWVKDTGAGSRRAQVGQEGGHLGRYEQMETATVCRWVQWADEGSDGEQMMTAWWDGSTLYDFAHYVVVEMLWLVDKTML